jgi:Tol biopolymer transport system component
MFEPAWSRDGRQIAWSQSVGARERIWIAAADGSGAHPASGLIDSLGQIAWLPRSRLIYWANSRLFLLPPGGRSSLFSIYGGDGFSLDARGARIATGDPSCSTGCNGPILIWKIADRTKVAIGGRNAMNTSPTFSRDGSRIAFARSFCERNGRCERPAGIWVASIADRKLEQLTRTGCCPDWSPDGRRLLYVDLVAHTVRLVGADGGATARLFRGVFAGPRPPAWSPDSRSVAVVTGPHAQLVIVDAVTRRARPVTGFSVGAVSGFSWSPDSSRLLVSAKSTAASCSSLWIVDAKRGIPHLLRRCY